MKLDDKTYSEGETLMIFKALKRALTADHDTKEYCDAQLALLGAALHVGLVTENSWADNAAEWTEKDDEDIFGGVDDD